VPAAARKRVAEPLASAFASTFWWSVGLSLLALVPAVVLARAERRAREREAVATPAA